MKDMQKKKKAKDTEKKYEPRRTTAGQILYAHGPQPGPAGTGHTSPNPLVGCVLVKNDQVVGRGYHRQYGGPHAEVEALERAGRTLGGAPPTLL